MKFKIETPYKKIASFKTVGELRKALKKFDDDQEIGFINQFQQDLYMRKSGDKIILGFQ